MADRRYFVKVYEEIVEEVQQLWDLLTTDNVPIPPEEREKPYYMVGTYLEIINVLNAKDESGNDWVYRKYPLIALICDFVEEPGGSEFYYSVDVSVLIAVETDPDLVYMEKVDINLIPILQPIYELLLGAMDDSRDIETISIDDFRPQKINRLNHGVEGAQGNEGLIFNDTIDVMQLNFRKLKVPFPEDCEE